jgi:hypothetical protein
MEGRHTAARSPSIPTTMGSAARLATNSRRGVVAVGELDLTDDRSWAAGRLCARRPGASIVSRSQPSFATTRPGSIRRLANTNRRKECVQ